MVAMSSRSRSCGMRSQPRAAAPMMVLWLTFLLALAAISSPGCAAEAGEAQAPGALSADTNNTTTGTSATGTTASNATFPTVIIVTSSSTDAPSSSLTSTTTATGFSTTVVTAATTTDTATSGSVTTEEPSTQTSVTETSTTNTAASSTTEQPTSTASLGTTSVPASTSATTTATTTTNATVTTVTTPNTTTPVAITTDLPTLAPTTTIPTTTAGTTTETTTTTAAATTTTIAVTTTSSPATTTSSTTRAPSTTPATTTSASATSTLTPTPTPTPTLTTTSPTTTTTPTTTSTTTTAPAPPTTTPTTTATTTEWTFWPPPPPLTTAVPQTEPPIFTPAPGGAPGSPDNDDHNNANRVLIAFGVCAVVVILTAGICYWLLMRRRRRLEEDEYLISRDNRGGGGSYGGYGAGRDSSTSTDGPHPYHHGSSGSGLSVTRIITIQGADFCIDRAIGSGAHGTVFHGRRLADAADVAVKQVPLVSRPQLDEAQRGVDGFLTLPRHRFLVPVLVAAIRLNESAAHGALMAADRIIHDSTRVGSLLLVTPFYRNGDATRLVAEFHGKNQLVPPKLVVGYLVQACEGLLALHEAGIIHRSVRPENLLLSDDYRSIALTDFGGSVLNPRRDAFSSPEVGFAGGVWQATPAADAWSLGFVAIFLAAARSDTDRILADHGAAGLPSFNVAVRRATAHMDPRFPEVVLALTVQDPKGRLSVADARARLVEILRDLSS